MSPERKPNTKPTIGQRWPRNAEGQRRDIRASADDVREIVEEAEQLLESARTANEEGNKIVVRLALAKLEARLAEIQAGAADIQRLTVEARIGVEPEAE